MILSKQEKRAIFFALLENYPKHERGRRQAKHLFTFGTESSNKLVEALKQIDEQEAESYKLLNKFAKAVNMKLSPYTKK